VKLDTSFPVALKYHLTEDETGRDGKTMGKTWENLEKTGENHGKNHGKCCLM
jgi:hypothetical protein